MHLKLEGTTFYNRFTEHPLWLTFYIVIILGVSDIPCISELPPRTLTAVFTMFKMASVRTRETLIMLHGQQVQLWDHKYVFYILHSIFYKTRIIKHGT